MRPRTLIYALAVSGLWALLAAGGCGGDGGAIGLTGLADTSSNLEIVEEVVEDAVEPECRRDSDCASVFADIPQCEVAHCREDGRCALAEAPAGDPCDDGDPCLGPDQCRAGVCEPAGALDGVACDDDDPCTEGDLCLGGRCASGPARSCGDDDPCTDDRCEEGVGCVNSPRVCPRGTSPCEVGVCDPTTGSCGLTTLGDGEACDDGLDCTYGTTCQGGACVGFVAGECDDGEVCTVDLCTDAGCVHQPRSGGCDDGDACTLDDRCEAGECVGDVLPCVDGDPCTEDGCSEGRCRFSPIAGCEPPSEGCEGKPVGASCDDGDDATLADLCLLDGCAGFRPTRISAGAGGEGRRFTHLGRVDGQWYAALELEGASDGALGALAALSSSGTSFVQPQTRHGSPFTALHGAFAADRAGTLWELSGQLWSDQGALSLALSASGAGSPRSLWVFEDFAGPRLWIVGEATLGGPWLRRCSLSASGGGTCQSQSLPIVTSLVPQAVTGTLTCDLLGCSPTLIAVADLFDTTGVDGVPRYFNDIYWNDGGVFSDWQVDAFDPSASAMTSRDIAAIAPGLFIAVGGFGYLRENTPLGVWGDPVVITQDQAALHFEGVWAGGGATVIVGWRSDGAGRELVLLVAPQHSDPSDPSAWWRYSLGAELGDDGGLFDVWGDGAGGLMLVGGGRSEMSGPAEALLFARQPE